MKSLMVVLGVIVSLLVTGCGGGGGGGAASNSPASSATAVIASSGGSITLSNNAAVTIGNGVVIDGTQVTVSTTPAPPVSTPTGVSPASLAVHIEIPANALQTTLPANSGISIEIPVNQTAKAISLSSVADSFKTVAVRIDQGTKVTWGYAKYAATTAADGSMKVATWVGSKYLDGINATGSLVASGVLKIDAFVQDTKGCFQGPQLNKLYHVVRPMSGQTLSPALYADANSPNYSDALSPNSNKIPLVLVHGIQLSLDTCTDAYKNTWASWIAHFYEDPDLSNRYQLFTYSYDTSKAIRDESTGDGSGRDFAKNLLQITGTQKAVVVAHSMGGIVARSALVYDAAPIDKLITLGSPHHGTLLRKVDELLIKNGVVNSSTTALFAEGAWFLTLDVQGARQLDWDNFDAKVLSCSFFANQTCNAFLRDLNSLDTNLGKYTLFAGLIADPLVKGVYDYLGFPDGAGDVVVPKVSALFQDYDPARAINYYDKPIVANRVATFPVGHSGLHDDPTWPASNPASVFAAVRNALLPPFVAMAGTGNNDVIIVTFSKAMDASTINSSTFTVSGPAGLVAGTITYNAATNTASFSPSASLARNTTYTVTLTSGVKDTAGDALLYFNWGVTTSSTPNSTTLYICDDTGKLGTVDVVTGTVTVIGSMGVLMTDIALAPNGDLYGVSSTSLYKVDPNTGAATLIGNSGAYDLNALAFRSDGTLFAAGSQSLYTLNISTGQKTFVGYTGFTSGGDLEFDATGNLFLATLYSSQLIQLNTTSNANGSVFKSMVGSFPFANIYGLALGRDGVMYGVAGNTIFSIDTVTGATAPKFTTFAGQGLGVAYGATRR